MNATPVRYAIPEKNFWDISETAWDTFIDHLKTGGKRFRQSRTEKGILQALYSSGRSHLLYDEGKQEIVAHTAFWLHNANWNEIGTVWVHETYAGNGFARLMITSFFERARRENSSAFLISDKPALIHIMRSLGWRRADEIMECRILREIACEEDDLPRLKKPESEIWFWVQ